MAGLFMRYWALQEIGSHEEVGFGLLIHIAIQS
jgi:hypothetical protein